MTTGLLQTNVKQFKGNGRGKKRGLEIMEGKVQNTHQLLLEKLGYEVNEEVTRSSKETVTQRITTHSPPSPTGRVINIPIIKIKVPVE